MAMGRVCKCVSKYYSLMVKIEPRRTVFLGRDIWHLPLLFFFSAKYERRFVGMRTGFGFVRKLAQRVIIKSI